LRTYFPFQPKTIIVAASDIYHIFKLFLAAIGAIPILFRNVYFFIVDGVSTKIAEQSMDNWNMAKNLALKALQTFKK
jgi:hypothetical protein